MNVKEYIEKVQSGEINVEEYLHNVFDELEQIKDYNYMNTISKEQALAQVKTFNKKGKLSGLPISIKDSICVKNVESTAGSKILKGYIPPFNATCVQQAINEGAIVIGKTSQDEFGFGGFSVNVGLGFKIPKNPFDKNRSCGGSSGGAAGLTQKAKFAHIAFGESTGGSLEQPSSFCGTFGLCPTYGRVSRYGLIDYGNSLDKVGPVGKTAYDVALMQEVISGYDSKDSTSANQKVNNFTSALNKNVKGMKIGIIKEALNASKEDVKKQFWNSIHKLESEGVIYKEISLELPIKYGIATYYLISTSEASTNLAKFNGMKYGAVEPLKGNFEEYFTKVRSKNFGKEAKRRIMLGTFARSAGYRDAYYLKALKLRTLMINEYKKEFKKYDSLALPTVPMLPPKFDEIKKMSVLDQYNIDLLTVGPNVTGLPHINTPVGFQKDLPVGTMFVGDHWQESKILQLAKEF